MATKHTPERIRELDEMANQTADVVFVRMEPAQKWLEARKAGEGSPADGQKHHREINKVLVNTARAVRDLEADGLGEISGCRRLAGAVAQLRGLSGQLTEQILADKRSS